MKKKITFLGYTKKKTRLIKFLRNKKNFVKVYGNKYLNKNVIEKSDLIISFGYKKIISNDLLNISKKPIINLHISYLPYNRGAHPNFWSFIDDTPKGVTIHEMNEKIDKGDILFRKKIFFKRSIDLTFKNTFEILKKEIEKLFIKNYSKILNGNYKKKKIILKGSFHNKNQLPKNLKSWDVKIANYLKLH